MRWFTAFLAVVGLGACAEQPVATTPTPPPPPPTGGPAREAADEPGVVRYFDRRVPLGAMLQGFPFRFFVPDVEGGEMFFIDKSEGDTMRRIPLAGEVLSLSDGAVASQVDWSARNLFRMVRGADGKRAWLLADEKNEERMNVWALDLESGAVTPVTDADYLYGFGLDEAEAQLAYVARTGTKAPYRSCLHVRRLATGEDREVVCDSPALTYTWSVLRFSPDGRFVFFNGNQEGDRKQGQLLRVDLSAKTAVAQVVTDPKVSRRAPHLLKGWRNGEAFFTANDDGYWNLYRYRLADGRIRQLTRFDEDVTSAELTDDGIIAVHRTPKGSTLVLVDHDTGKTLDEQALVGTADVLDAHGHQAILQHASPDIVFEAWRVDTRGGKLERRKIIGLEPERERALVGCKATRVTIPTFDRELHAFLLEPREPLGDPKQRLALIRSFYGGKNRYERFDQILCATGFTVVSPAVRGSYGFGKAFEALNDEDLGGDEIVDLFHVAKWVEAKTGLGPERIGVYGRSHGGYATMRALTFPAETSRGPRYPFGFGMSDAGFSDIKSFYDATNIPDWVVLESGDPAVPAQLARMNERSALKHAGRLAAPLLLMHGERDWRVPVEESRRFYEAARKLGKPARYLEVPGQGHHFKGLKAQTTAWQERLDFLQGVAERAPAD